MDCCVDSENPQKALWVMSNTHWRDKHLGMSFACYKVFSSVALSSPTLCDPMGCGTPGLPVHHQLLEFIQSHVRWVCDAIQPTHPLSSPSPPALSLSQHQGLFQWVFTSGGQSIGISGLASVLPMNIRDWSPLGWTGWISLLSKGLSRWRSICR